MAKPTPMIASATVTISEAATMTGRPPSTIRDWLKKGVILGNQDVKGRWLLDRVTVVAAAATAPTAARAIVSQLHQPGAAAPTVALTAGSAADPTVAKYIDSLQETVAREREENKELRGRIRELEQERTQHLSEMRALLSKETSNKEGVLSRWIRK